MKKIIIVMSCVCVFMAIISCSKKGEEMSQTSSHLEFDSLWVFHKPVETRVKFEELLPNAEAGKDKSYHLQLLTQIARTYGLEGNYEKSHEVLNSVESELNDNLKVVKVRYLLERGRTFRSSKEVEKSIPLFDESYNLALELKEDNYAIDAAHMMAIAVEVFDDRMNWSLKALQLAEKTTDERAKKWKGSLYNNIGWDYHDNGQFEQALDLFQKAQAFREEQGAERQIGIAKWCVARAKRSLEQYDEALVIQLALYEGYKISGEQDGYVFEELGELYLLKKDSKKSEDFFALAYEFLSKDNWMMENETARMERIKKLGNVK